jgi:hypothetical protein
MKKHIAIHCGDGQSAEIYVDGKKVSFVDFWIDDARIEKNKAKLEAVKSA